MLNTIATKLGITHSKETAVVASAKNSHKNGIAISIEELLALRNAIEKLNLDSFFKAKTLFAGDQSSSMRGRGIDFAEVRDYQMGDDIRHMDWRVTARTGKPHTKLFQEERERPVFIVVDYGPNMFFASKGSLKSVIAARVAAILAWVACKHGDKIGSIIFCGQERIESRPRNGLSGVLPLLKKLANQPHPWRDQIQPGALANAIKRIVRVAAPSSLIFIVSDFGDFDQESQLQLTYLRQYNDIVAFHIQDQLEIEPPLADAYSMTDGSDSLILDTTAKHICEDYSAYFLGKREQLKKSFAQRRIPYYLLRTDQDIVKHMQKIFSAHKNKKHMAHE